MDGLGIIGCEDAGGVFDGGVMCEDVPECNVVPPVGEGCCVFGPEDCMDGLGQEGCELDDGVFNAEVMCMDVAECNPEPLDGALLYEGSCALCHGVDAMGTGLGPNVVGATSQDIIDANMEMGLSPAEVDAVADFLGAL